MGFKGMFEDKSGIYQVMILLLLMLSFYMVASLITVVILFSTVGMGGDIFSRPDVLRWVQLLSVTGVFLLPAFGAAFLFSKHPKKYLFIENLPSGKSLLWVLLFMFLLTPIINLTALANKAMVLPGFMKGIEEWMQAKETQAEQLTELLLAGSGIGTFLMNILVIAIAAGITEEFFFRGALQRIFGKWSANHHIVIWTVALIFGAIHLQFYGLIPRTILGAFFGYLLYWTKNLWLPVFAHFVNNTFGVIAMSRPDWRENELISGEIPDHLIGVYIGWAAISTVLLYYCIRKFRKEQVIQ